MYGSYEKEITKEEFEKIKAGELNKYSFFTEAQVIGYGLIASQPFEREGKYYIPYSMSNSCD